MKKINDEYDIGAAFEAIEEELIASMVRNMRRHKVDEAKEGKQWSMWQAEQLKSLKKYQNSNRKKYKKQFSAINARIETLIRIARDEGGMEQEIAILEALKRGFSGKRVSNESTAEFFRINDRKLDALIRATIDDMEKAETAVLRMANDQYRKIIFNAQVYASTGAGTYEKAVDMVMRDFLSAGLNCVQYANGARHTLADYADMAIRTACKRAYLQGEGEKRQEWGIHTVIMNKRGNPCPKCLPFCGKVLIDDVWSGGSRQDGPYPLMSYAIGRGLYHPRCKDAHTTYFPGISTADDIWTEEELEAIGQASREEAKQQYAERQAEKYGRLTKYSLDEENRERYRKKENEWKTVAEASDSGIIKMYRKNNTSREGFRFVSDETFERLTIQARKKGAVILRGTKEIEEHLDRMGAAASNVGDILMFRKDVCISEVLEETYHFEQNLAKLNNDKGEPIRSILNEIDAKQYLLENAEKYKIPRMEIELTQKQLEFYQQELEKYQQGGK